MSERDDDVTPQRKRIAVARANNRFSVVGVERGRFVAVAMLATENHAPTARMQATSLANSSELRLMKHLL